MTPDARAPRIAIFTHDTYGLGHVRRCLHIARVVARHKPDAAILFITGCPALHAFARLPCNLDYVKIPTIAKTGSEDMKPPHLPIALAEVYSLRERLIKESLLTFAPDVLLVDNFPLGSRRELLPSLEALSKCRTRTVIGLRDIVDAPHKVRADWARGDIYQVLEDYYDRILVYGIREVQDVCDAFGLSPSISRKVHYCGYVTDRKPRLRSAAEVREELGFDGPFIVATVGGGGDGFPLIQNFLQALRLLPKMRAMVITGPLMSPAHRDQLRDLKEDSPRVVVRDYVRDLPSYMAAADLVVGMAGYNTTAEILALQSCAILVPRTWRYGEHLTRATADKEWEQLLRAEALEKLGWVDLLRCEDLNPQRLAELIDEVLSRPCAEERRGVDLGGVESAARHLLELANGQGDLSSVAR